MDRNTPKTISNYSKVTEFKVNEQKLITFPNTSNEQMKFEIKSTIALVMLHYITPIYISTHQSVI